MKRDTRDRGFQVHLFRKSVQLDRIGGERLEPHQGVEEEIVSLAAEALSENGAPLAIARVGRGCAGLLVGSGVDQVEARSGRSGLFFMAGATISTPRSAPSDLLRSLRVLKLLLCERFRLADSSWCQLGERMTYLAQTDEAAVEVESLDEALSRLEYADTPVDIEQSRSWGSFWKGSRHGVAGACAGDPIDVLATIALKGSIGVRGAHISRMSQLLPPEVQGLAESVGHHGRFEVFDGQVLFYGQPGGGK